MVSILSWMWMVVLDSAEGMSQKDLDHLFDSNANTIGSLLRHRLPEHLGRDPGTVTGGI